MNKLISAPDIRIHSLDTTLTLIFVRSNKDEAKFSGS